MTSCSTTILAANTAAYCRFCTYSIEIFTRAFAEKFCKQILAFGTSLKNKLFLVNSVKADSLAAGLNLNTVFQEKNARKMHLLRIMLQKQGASNI